MFLARAFLSRQEIEKLSRDVGELGLNVIVFGEWYNVELMGALKFFDDNTRSWWTPATGGLRNLGGSSPVVIPCHCHARPKGLML